MDGLSVMPFIVNNSNIPNVGMFIVSYRHYEFRYITEKGG